MLPALPKNGTMRTYENPSRTFTRPYSAKTVYFYKEGDLFFTGVRVPVSQHRYKTMHNLMDELNRSMYLPYGVRNITTPMGRTNINSLDQLQHLGRYVASSSKPPKGVDLDKIQEKYSATLRRDPQRTTAGGQAYWMPTSPTLPARLHRALRALSLISAKQVFFVLNGKGKFHRSLINPMKMPSLEQVLEECSTNLEVAIHRLYTPEGKLITSVEEILAHDGPRIIACPRNERPHLNDSSSAGSSAKLPEINPSRYAPRMAYSKANGSESNGSSPAVVNSLVSTGNSSGNSIEKRQRLPVLNQRYVPRKRQEPRVNGVKSSFATTSDFVARSKKVAASRATVSKSVPTNRRSVSRSHHSHSKSEDIVPGTSSSSTLRAASVASSSKNSKDSGTGNSINSSQQSERAASMTDRKAEMIRSELMSKINNQTSSDHYSEEDRILEEESDDYDHAGVAGPIESGTDEEEEEEEDSALGSTQKPSPLPRGKSSKTPSTSSSASAGSRRRKPISRHDTPYQMTPSRQTTANSTRPLTSESEKNVEEEEEEKEEKFYEAPSPSTSSESEREDDDEEDLTDDEDRETPAIHTPDTRMSTAKSRMSTRSSIRSFASESSKAWSRISGYSDKEVILPSDEEEDPYRDIGTAERERLGEAATVIQVAYKEYRTRQKKVQFEQEMAQQEKERQEYEDQFIVYTIEVLLGRRFGLDFDTPLYFVVHGENGSSEKIWTEKQDWLFTPSEYYEPDSWIVTNVKTKKLGVLTSVDVGHEKDGYGAGTYIERLVITEELLDGRRFLFQVEKWFDGGQVDGLIERNVKVNSFMYQIPFREGERRRQSRGRWEFRLHTMNSDLGGTTSNITVIGYGQYDSNANWVKNDSLFRDPYSVPLIQIDFGTDIGNLRKVRFEIDGEGDKPNYYLEYVEAQDLDTRERCVLMVNNWLLVEPTPGYKKWQPFREVAIFAKEYYPSTVKTYEGTITFADKSLVLSEDLPIYLQYFTENANDEDITRDASGLFPIIPIKMKNGNINYTYKVEFVTMDATPRIRILPQITKLGNDILSGLSVLRDVYDEVMHHGWLRDGGLSIGSELFIEEIHQKAGEHVPYGMTYGLSTIDFELNNVKGPFFKHMMPMTAIPTSTARKWKKSELRNVEESASWELAMSLDYGYGEPIIPTVVLVARDRTPFEMQCQMERPERGEGGMLLKYRLSVANFGNPHKVRVSCEESGPDSYTSVHKIMLTEVNTRTEVHMKVDSELNEFDTIELECIYPDIGENRNKEYEVHIRTIEGGGDFRPYINIIGDGGDTGYRAYPGITKFAPMMVVDMYVNSMNLRELREVEVWAKHGNPENWKGTMKIISDDELVYQSGTLELSENGQISMASLQFVEQIEPVVSGESKL